LLGQNSSQLRDGILQRRELVLDLGQAAFVTGPASVRLWDLATSRPIGAPLTGHTGPVTSVAFSRDGTTLAAGSADHTVRLWDVAYLVNVVTHLCASAGRSLTRAEWSRYVPGLAYQRVCP
jgi:WD40 repeat protein